MHGNMNVKRLVALNCLIESTRVSFQSFVKPCCGAQQVTDFQTEYFVLVQEPMLYQLCVH